MAIRIIRRDKEERIKEVVELVGLELFTPENRVPKVLIDMTNFALKVGGSVTIVDTIHPIDRYIIKQIKRGGFKESVRFYKEKTNSTWKASKTHCNRLKKKIEQGEFITI